MSLSRRHKTSFWHLLQPHKGKMTVPKRQRASLGKNQQNSVFILQRQPDSLSDGESKFKDRKPEVHKKKHLCWARRVPFSHSTPRLAVKIITILSPEMWVMDLDRSPHEDARVSVWWFGWRHFNWGCFLDSCFLLLHSRGRSFCCLCSDNLNSPIPHLIKAFCKI